MIRIGIDFGGTKIEGAAIAPGGEILARQRIATPPDYVSALATVRELVDRIETQVKSPCTVGVGHPGSVSSHTGKLRNANTAWLNDQLLGEHLKAMLRRPVRLANDANCLAVSEAVDGAGAGEGVVFAAILGTGVGGGVAVDRRVVVGRNAIGGEWGHMPLPWPTADEYPGPKCWCGRLGCMEAWTSGPAFERDYAHESGRTRSAADIAADARNGDTVAENALSRLVDRLARGLAVVCDVLDPDVIVLGGGLSNIEELYRWLPEAIGQRVFSDSFLTPVRPARWGDSSGVRGAAWLWSD